MNSSKDLLVSVAFYSLVGFVATYWFVSVFVATYWGSTLAVLFYIVGSAVGVTICYSLRIEPRDAAIYAAVVLVTVPIGRTLALPAFIEKSAFEELSIWQNLLATSCGYLLSALILWTGSKFRN